MKKNLGLLIALIGICIAGGAMVLTPNYSTNAVDTNSGIDASAAIFFGALVVFGAGVVIYANAVTPNAKKRAA